MNRLFIVIVLFVITSVNCWGRENAPLNSEQYATALLPTPVFNIPDFPHIFGGNNGKTLKMTRYQQIRELEFIALPETAFRIKGVIKKDNKTIYKVTTNYFPANKNLFVDSRFVKTIENKPVERPRQLPQKEVIVENLLSAEGTAYAWGGNIRNGIPEMLSFYPTSPDINHELRDRWMLKGLDCSGLLYDATNGYTPRNTNDLMDFGDPVPIAGMSVKQIIDRIEPLDLIIWQRHVIIIIDKDRVIESRLDYDKKKPGCQGGVRVRMLREVLEETLKNKVPDDDYPFKTKTGKKRFVIRRWYHYVDK